MLSTIWPLYFSLFKSIQLKQAFFQEYRSEYPNMQPTYFSVSKFLFNMKAKYDEPLEWGFPVAKQLFLQTHLI